MTTPDETPENSAPRQPPPRFNRSNPLYDSLLELKLEKEREVPRFAIWTNDSAKTAWLISPISMSILAAVLLAIGVGYFYFRLAPATQSQVMVEKRTLPQLTNDEEIAAIHASISGFIAAETLEDQLTFVRHPERSRRRMEEYYSRESIRTKRQVIDYPMIAKTDLPPRYHFFVAQALCSDNSRPVFTVMQSGLRYLIDWESSVGYNPMGWDTYLRLKPHTPLDWRIHVTPSDYFTGAFSDPTLWKSVRLSYPNSDSVNYAWYPVDHADAATLAALTQPGSSRPLILKLSFIDSSGMAPQLQLLKLVNDTWLIP
ncbi:MAG: hypothetical protein ACI9R3_003612 [Verrucomicrobiales bacterium]|jgi:hypothetical protein